MPTENGDTIEAAVGARTWFVVSIFISSIAISSPSWAGPQTGIASVYGSGDGHAGSRTANGGRLNPAALTAAHRTLPFGTQVAVVNQRNGKQVIVRITDRGPFVRGRIIDLTPAGARAIGVSGLAPVRLTVVGG
jgi:rare lipoprotein A